MDRVASQVQRRLAIISWFPDLAKLPFEPTSDPTWEYNCIAWAAGDAANVWWPKIAYWPPGCPVAETMIAFEKAFNSIGYTRCSDHSLEPDFEKIAIYAKDGIPKHAARQLPDGKWTSKLGPQDDISHTIDGLNGKAYGKPAIFMKRPC